MLDNLEPEPPKPVMLNQWQYYHKTHGAAVSEEYQSRGGSSSAKRIATRNEIAREPFIAMPEEQQQQLNAARVEEHEEHLEEWRKAVEKRKNRDMERPPEEREA